MKSLLLDELKDLQKGIEFVNSSITQQILESIRCSQESVIMEIRAATGGQEASLFASNVYHMYSNMCKRYSWKNDILKLTGDINSIKELIVRISGPGVEFLHAEKGVHRVQRVPTTDTSGRVHTSTITVAVLEDVDHIPPDIDKSQFHIETKKSTGAGGQHTNKTESAIRLTHIPTNLSVTIQEDRSQHRNKEIAFRLILSRIAALEKEKQTATRLNQRKNQVLLIIRCLKDMAC